MGPFMGSKTQGFSQRTPIRLQPAPPSLAGLDMKKRVGKKKYERKLAKLQDQLREVSLAYRAQHRRAVIVFEGWDARGGGERAAPYGAWPGLWTRAASRSGPLPRPRRRSRASTI